MTDQRPWPRGRLAVLALLTINFVVIAIWAIVDFARYEKAAIVVPALFAGTLYLLRKLSVRRAGAQTFSEFIGSAPVRVVTFVTTALLWVGGPIVVVPPRVELNPLVVRVEPASAANVLLELLRRDSVIARFPVERGERRLRLTTGDHDLRVSADGYRAELATVRLRRYGVWRADTARLVLEPLLGQLTLVPTAPQQPRVSIVSSGGVPVVGSQLLSRERTWPLSPGEYRVEAEADGHTALMLPVVLNPSEVETVFVALSRAPAPPPSPPAPTHGTVSFTSVPPGADVFVAGIGRIGTTPLTRSMRAGSYRVLLRLASPLSADQGDVRTERLTVIAGTPASAGGALRAVSLARLLIAASPAGGGDYVAIDVDAGIEHRLGSASGLVERRLYPGAYRLYRAGANGRVEGPQLQLASGQRISVPGF